MIFLKNEKLKNATKASELRKISFCCDGFLKKLGTKRSLR